MPLSINIYDDVSPKAYPAARHGIHLFYLKLTTRTMPWPIKVALRSAYVQYSYADNERNTARWIHLIYEVCDMWKNRASRPEIVSAQKLFTSGWRMITDWPIHPDLVGELIYSIRLGKRRDDLPGYELTDEFLWDAVKEARRVPVERVYDLLQLDHKSTDEEIRAWNTCFWLGFLTENELYSLVQKERKNR